MEDKECEKYLAHEAIEEAFKKKLDALTNKIFNCLEKCYKKTFISWTIYSYNSHPKHYIEDLAEQSFTDTLLVFQNYVASNGLYKGDTKIKNILQGFYHNVFRNKLRDDLKNPLGNSKNKPEDVLNNKSPDELPDKEELLVCLEKTITQMDEDDQKIIKWRHLENINNQVIAQRLGITYKSATNKIYRCMERLRALMEKCKNN